ncbi:hypothetical protein NBRC110019_15070 [Neptunitalea chrysea]|uniref:Uncharacterized protein n=1 Tax=Neptunitalea chrysea TaxID=1647581 RepID=A0A9W6B718_9FLAO|nr:hypothetical protein [Neptunitalea chrysea]GLB52467.1 hypothetical protein NBRC110019_15070 [Neptunitalea chrysea]
MKKIVIIVALFMLCKPIIPVLEYIVFYDYIKNELCENKDKPAMHCNGKCHLAKQLAKASDAEKETKDKKQFSLETSIVFCQELPAGIGLDLCCTDLGNTIIKYYNSLYTHLRISTLLRPPIS